MIEKQTPISSPIGLQVATALSSESHQKILQFCLSIGINIFDNSASSFSDPVKEMHSTLLACNDSKDQTVDSLQQAIDKHQLVGKVTGWKLIGRNNNMLALTFDSPDMDELHHSLQESTGLQHNFNNFIKHVTVHYNYTGDLPTQLPDFDILFDQVEAKIYIPLSEPSKNLATQPIDLSIDMQHSEKVEKVSDLIYSRINNMSNILKELRGNTPINSFKIKP